MLLTCSQYELGSIAQNGEQEINQRKDDVAMVILNIQQAAKFLGKTPAALRNGYKRWGVPHFRLGGQIKFTQEALQEWVAKNMVEATAEPSTAEPKNKPAAPVDGRRSKRGSVKAASRP
jgi:hypothetical protein